MSFYVFVGVSFLETITYPLIIDKELWTQFKELVPRTKTLNDALVELVEERVREADKEK